MLIFSIRRRNFLKRRLLQLSSQSAYISSDRKYGQADRRNKSTGALTGLIEWKGKKRILYTFYTINVFDWSSDAQS